METVNIFCDLIHKKYRTMRLYHILLRGFVTELASLNYPFKTNLFTIITDMSIFTIVPDENHLSCFKKESAYFFHLLFWDTYLQIANKKP